jgi:hypothetical protein
MRVSRNEIRGSSEDEKNVEALINDTGMKKQVERIKGHEWVKVVEGRDDM